MEIDLVFQKNGRTGDNKKTVTFTSNYFLIGTIRFEREPLCSQSPKEMYTFLLNLFEKKHIKHVIILVLLVFVCAKNGTITARRK